MRVCLIGPVPPFRGGIAKYCYSLAKALEERHELLLLSYARQYPAILYGKKPQIDGGIDREAVRREFRNLSFAVDSASVGSWRQTSRTIEAFRPDLVILPWWVTYWAPMYLYLLRDFRKKGIQVVVLCINVFEHEDNALKRALTRLVLTQVDRMVVHSGKEKEQLAALNPKATVKEHLLPLFEYHQVPQAPRAGRLNLLFFGFVRPYKGLDTLLQALALLKGRDLHLTVAGEFWKDKDDYLQLIERLGIAGRVEMVDRYVSEEEMTGYFSAADLVVLPYKRSITSGVIATAYGYGKPVLATRVGGFHEVVQDGVTGKLVPPDDPQALADGILWFLENQGIDFAGNIDRFTASKMSWPSLVDLIETLTRPRA
ncbi:MAG TPA: glycosyltransferase [Geomonas sp.]|nr:glycosyltransferase [Geomonas sp.]